MTTSMTALYTAASPEIRIQQEELYCPEFNVS